MTRAASLLLCVLLAACATPPRAIIPPKAEVKKLDVAPVTQAAADTKTAVREIAKAGTETRRANDSLRDEIERAGVIAALYPDMSEAFAEIRRRSETLAARIAFAEEKELVALQTIDAMDGEIGLLTARVASQSTQIDHADAAQDMLREQLEALSGSDAKRIIAENKLQWWRWRFAPVSIGIIFTGILFSIYRPRLPFP